MLDSSENIALVPSLSWFFSLGIDGPLSEEAKREDEAQVEVMDQTSNDTSSRASTSCKCGRTKKADHGKKIVAEGSRRPTRQNNARYKHDAIPMLPHSATASKAKKLELLRLEEMRGQGFEKCQIAPEELTDDKLLQEHSG